MHKTELAHALPDFDPTSERGFSSALPAVPPEICQLSR